jgi:hypothetical protein
MIFKDFNQTLVPPSGLRVVDVMVDGAYLQVTYSDRPDDEEYDVEHRVSIFLNDQGREVARTEELLQWPVSKPALEPPPVGSWYQFREGFYTALLGLQEMFRCLNRS